jgi:hypothetical protein
MQTLLSARLPRTSGAPRAAAQRRAAASACPLAAPHAAAAAALAPRFRRATRHAAARAASGAVAQFKNILSAEIPVHLPRCAAPRSNYLFCPSRHATRCTRLRWLLAARHTAAPPRLAQAAVGCPRRRAPPAAASAPPNPNQALYSTPLSCAFKAPQTPQPDATV